MAKGAEAKQYIADKMAEMFGEDWIGEYEKKYYIWSRENGERIQIAISMTCPKTPINILETSKTIVENDSNSNWDWGWDNAPSAVTNNISIEITDEEKKNLAELINKLGL